MRLTKSSVKTGKWSDREQREDGARKVSDDEMTRSRV